MNFVSSQSMNFWLFVFPIENHQTKENLIGNNTCINTYIHKAKHKAWIEEIQHYGLG